MKLKVFSVDGLKAQEKIFSKLPVLETNKGKQALRDFIIAYQSNQRQGNACTKTRSSASGGNRKPWKQKGTGMARHGSRRSPIWVGGGVAFGPKPRSFSKKITQKVKALAFKRALINRILDKDIDLIESLHVDKPKTKIFNKIIFNIYPKGKILIVDKKLQNNICLASKNISRISICDYSSLNAWELIRFKKILFSEQAFQCILNKIACSKDRN